MSSMSRQRRLAGTLLFLLLLQPIVLTAAQRSSQLKASQTKGWRSFLSRWKGVKTGSESLSISHRKHASDIPTMVKHSGQTPKVSRVIHQSWKTDQVDPSIKPWQNSWKEKNPGWTYILWTDDMNRKLVERHYPWFLETYDSFPEPAAGILRADSVRYMYMHHFGGVYADLDFRALKPMEELYFGTTSVVLLGKISKDINWPNNIPNAWMASTMPGHPFWLTCLVEVIKMAAVIGCGGPECFTDYRIEKTTGPMLLWNSVKAWQAKGEHPKYQLHLLRPGLIYPIDWRHMYSKNHVCYKWYNREEKDCYEKFPDAYAITYWSHVWDTHHRDNDVDDDE